MTKVISFVNMFPVIGGVNTIALAQSTEGVRYRQAIVYHEGVYSIYREVLDRDKLVRYSADDKSYANDIVLIDAILAQQ